MSPEHWPAAPHLDLALGHCVESRLGARLGMRRKEEPGRPGVQAGGHVPLTYSEGLASWWPWAWVRVPGEWDLIADTPAGSGAARGL